jgi:hypothetical protein
VDIYGPQVQGNKALASVDESADTISVLLPLQCEVSAPVMYHKSQKPRSQCT